MNDNREPKQTRQWDKSQSKIDKHVVELIKNIEDQLRDSIEPITITDLNSFQRKQIYQHFEKGLEFKIKSYREHENVILKVYPIGKLRRLAEVKAQEVLMKGDNEALPPMGSFERFIIHDYLKGRDGIKTESTGEGRDRHITLLPVFGRTPKKAKRRLTR